MKEVPAAKAYSGRTNLEHIKKIGGVAYIPFRSNARGRTHRHGSIWVKCITTSCITKRNSSSIIT